MFPIIYHPRFILGSILFLFAKSRSTWTDLSRLYQTGLSSSRLSMASVVQMPPHFLLLHILLKDMFQTRRYEKRGGLVCSQSIGIQLYFGQIWNLLCFLVGRKIWNQFNDKILLKPTGRASRLDFHLPCNFWYFVSNPKILLNADGKKISRKSRIIRLTRARKKINIHLSQCLQNMNLREPFKSDCK